MVKKTVQIVNELGLHARPASRIAQVAGGFGAEITIGHGDARANAKSILGILTLAAPKGSEVWIEAEGADAQDAVDALAKLFASGFGEFNEQA